MRRYVRRSFVALDRANAIQALESLASSDLEQALPTYLDILRAFADSPNDGLSIRVPMSNGQLARLQHLPVRVGLVECVRAAKWEATYTHPTIEALPVITVRSPDRPKTRRTFSIAGHGRRRYERSTIKRIKENKMATRTRKGTTRSKTKAAEVDELEGLEELEELEDLDEVEEEAPKPKRTRRTRKAKAEPEPEEDDEDEDDELDEDEDDEDEAPAPKRRGRAKSTPTKSRASTKTKSTQSPTRKPPPRRELPSGKVGPDVIADLAGVETRDVRIYLRKQEVEKDEETGRYVFTQKQAEAHAKRIKKARA